MPSNPFAAYVMAMAPTVLAVLAGILINNARLTGLRWYMEARFNNVDRRFDAVDRRFEEMKEMWRSGLHRVEDFLDARLQPIEER